MKRKIVALDFETYYDDDYSLRTMSTYNYIYDERFDAYLVAIYGDGGKINFVGNPKDADWSVIHDAIVVAHNASFDEFVMTRLYELGIIPKEFIPHVVYCTADMAAYFECKRDLATASKILLGEEMDKTVRTNMKGKTYQDAVAAGMLDDLLAYGGKDAVQSYRIAEAYLPKWPELEREVSNLNRYAGFRGVHINTELAEQFNNSLKQQLHECLGLIPWAEDENVKLLSPAAPRTQGRLDGIPVPTSLAKDDEAVMQWVEEYGEKYPWVRAIFNYRSINGLQKRVQAVIDNLRPDGTMSYQCKYFGAHTGRMSGGGDSGGKFNMQNMPRSSMYGVDLRHLFTAAPGKVFVLADYSQVEARCLLWRVNDVEFLKLIEQEGNLYQAYAKNTGRYSGSNLKKDDPKGYQYAKASVLGLGYGCGPGRFRSMAKTSYGVELTDEEAKHAVDEFRSSNPLITNYWRTHHQWLRLSAAHRDDFHGVELVSGRLQSYYNPHFEADTKEIVVTPVRGANSFRIYGGKLVENEIQATCRDLFVDAWVRVSEAGYPVIWTIHDELVAEVDEDKAEEAAEAIANIMRTVPEWATGCPIDVETTITKHYRK